MVTLRALAGLAVAVALVSGCQKGAPEETRSAILAAAADRANYLCHAMPCPSKVQDAAFVRVRREGGLFGALPGETTFHAVVKVKPDDVSHWSAGCDPMRFNARPAWAPGLFDELKLAPKSVPDTMGCPPNHSRVIHVKEGVVVVWMTTEE